MIGVVEDINRDRRSLFHSQDWAGNLAVIPESVNSFAGRDVKRDWRDVEGEIGFALRRVDPSSQQPGYARQCQR